MKKRTLISFWRMLPKISDYLLKVRKNNLSNKGIVHLEAEKNITLYISSPALQFLICWIKFAINIEAQVIEYLLSNNKTKICWDCDSSFTNNSISQAGYFLENKKEWSYYKTNASIMSIRA